MRIHEKKNVDFSFQNSLKKRTFHNIIYPAKAIFILIKYNMELKLESKEEIVP